MRSTTGFYLIFLLIKIGFVEAAEKQSLQEKLIATANQQIYNLEYNDGKFSGPAWDFLLEEGKQSQFFLIGEEHGIAENPKLAAALFKALVPSGYSKFAIETSPQMASSLEQAARQDGMNGMVKLFENQSSNVAFFGMYEEAEMLVEIVKSMPEASNSIWGLDYEVLADRYLISQLQAKQMNLQAQSLFNDLKQASNDSWQKHKETGNPQYIFSFSAHPSIISTLREAWPEADSEALAIMNTLEQTFKVNQLWVAGKGWESNLERSNLLKNNLINYWSKTTQNKAKPKVFFKFGASHLIRGRNMSEVYDIGNLLPELANLNSSKSFNLMVLQGNNSQTAVLDPTQLRYKESDAKDGYHKGLQVLTSLAAKDSFTLIDLRPLRSVLSRQKNTESVELMRVIHGYDALLILSGSTASKNLLPEMNVSN